MARGWESKSVESQMDDAKQEQPEDGNSELTVGQKKAKRARANLMLARAQVLHQLEAATNERYKEMLQQELNELDRQINAI